jgi:hypothetical protein
MPENRHFLALLLILRYACQSHGENGSAESYPDWAARGCSVALEVAAEVDTKGCAGFEAFSVGHGHHLIAAANFWDGKSSDMSAHSVLYRMRRRKAKRKLELVQQQSMPTKGAHGWDFFETVQGDKLLVVPNYYGCGSSRGPTQPGLPLHVCIF